MNRISFTMRIIIVMILSIMIISAVKMSVAASDKTNILIDNNIVNVSDCTDDRGICNKLRDQLGQSTTIKVSMQESSACKYAYTVVLVNGEVTTVYLSQKPTTADVGVSMDDDGRLIVDGISSADKSDTNQYCSIEDTDPLCQAVMEAFQNEKRKSVSYRFEKNEIYRYEAEFITKNGVNILYFDSLPYGGRSTYSCDRGYLTSKACNRLYDVFGSTSERIFSFQQSPFYRFPVDVQLGGDEVVTVWLLLEPTPEQSSALSSSISKQTVKSENGLNIIFVISLVITLANFVCLLVMLVIVIKKKRGLS